MTSPRTLPAAGGGPPNPAHLPLFTVLSAYADALDALPLDLTRSFSDLRELDAVLGTHLSSLTARLYTLASALSDPELTPAQRLLALKDCAEEARAYKEGGEDKIRVAVNTAETIASHTDFIDRLSNGILGSTIPELAPALRPSSGRFLHHSRVPYDPQRDRYMVDTVTDEDLPESYNSVEYAITTLKAQAAANGELGGSSSTKSNNALASRFNLNLQAGGTGSSFGMLGPSFHTHHGAGAAAAAVAAAAVLNRPNATSSTASGSGGGAAAGSSGGAAGHSAAGGTERGANASGSGSHGGGHGGASGSGSAHDGHSSSHTAAHHHHHHQSASSSSTHHRSERAGGSSSHHAHAAAQNSSHSERHGGGGHGSAQHSGGGGSHSRSAHHQHSNNSSSSHGNSHHAAAHANETSHSTSSRSHSSHHAHANSSAAGNHGSGASHSTSVRESNKGSFGGSSSRGVAASHSASNNNASASAAAVAASGGMNMSEDQEDQTRYCYCQQVSYGEMIACDSRDCPYEWFHLVCVNLTVVPPEGSKWYCDHCLEKRAKKKGKSGARGAR
ncbi:hypothetical protein CF327_g1596 [Tilletia walkeri]|uniref:Chromatin modification-related protein n=1 Tax=Tilletia walkeri TaxID=117179 RepID=A0A8X7N5A2_9BASI|nr:hypothetical protein CF327_g1596 [Tilletia walkeri]KAE8266060.1 hypothetical protein A4X09_0g6286 [Tilletia walkeri]